MKNTLAGMIAVTGLILAGAEAETITMQFIGCSIGLAMFGASMYWIAAINRRS